VPPQEKEDTTSRIDEESKQTGGSFKKSNDTEKDTRCNRKEGTMKTKKKRKEEGGGPEESATRRHRKADTKRGSGEEGRPTEENQG